MTCSSKGTRERNTVVGHSTGRTPQTRHTGTGHSTVNSTAWTPNDLPLRRNTDTVPGDVVILPNGLPGASLIKHKKAGSYGRGPDKRV